MQLYNVDVPGPATGIEPRKTPTRPGGADPRPPADGPAGSSPEADSGPRTASGESDSRRAHSGALTYGRDAGVRRGPGSRPGQHLDVRA
jgi:hypothetical protein